MLVQKGCQTYRKTDKKRPSREMEGIEYQIIGYDWSQYCISGGGDVIFQQISQQKSFLLLLSHPLQ
jgi:hypothetical protein